MSAVPIVPDPSALTVASYQAPVERFQLEHVHAGPAAVAYLFGASNHIFLAQCWRQHLHDDLSRFAACPAPPF
jgi:hypothetical protein